MEWIVSLLQKRGLCGSSCCLSVAQKVLHLWDIWAWLGGPCIHLHAICTCFAAQQGHNLKISVFEKQLDWSYGWVEGCFISAWKSSRGQDWWIWPAEFWDCVNLWSEKYDQFNSGIGWTCEVRDMTSLILGLCELVKWEIILDNWVQHCQTIHFCIIWMLGLVHCVVSRRF